MNFFKARFNLECKFNSIIGIRVELMVSQWEHTNKRMIYYLRSLLDINGALLFNNVTDPNLKRNIVKGSISIVYTPYFVIILSD